MLRSLLSAGALSVAALVWSPATSQAQDPGNQYHDANNVEGVYTTRIPQGRGQYLTVQVGGGLPSHWQEEPYALTGERRPGVTVVMRPGIRGETQVRVEPAAGY